MHQAFKGYQNDNGGNITKTKTVTNIEAFLSCFGARFEIAVTRLPTVVLVDSDSTLRQFFVNANF